MMEDSTVRLKVAIVTLTLLARSVYTSDGPDSTQTFTESDAFEYLQKFQYLNVSDVTTFSAGSDGDNNLFRDKIKLFQEDAGLDITGELDTNTIDVMVAPRCGVPFAAEQVGGERPKWKKKTLTYRILEYSRKSGLSQSDIRKTMKRALKYWQDVADLEFVETKEKSDIEIMFGSELHGDGLPFDQTGGVLAHAYYPTSNEIGGDAHFDDDEPWSVTYNVGKQLLQTATHELGHSLGLSHSRQRGSVMYFSYPGWDKHLKLHQDDIDKIQELYGKKKITVPRKTTPSPRVPDVVDLRRETPKAPCQCEDYIRFDTKTRTNVGNCLTAFKRKKWCYVSSGASCEDKKKSSSVNRYWSWEACIAPVTPPPNGCQCNGLTRYDARTDKTVGHCQTQYRGNYWCYIAADSVCDDKRGTRRDEDGKRYWSASACSLQTDFQRDTIDVPLILPGLQVEQEG